MTITNRRLSGDDGMLVATSGAGVRGAFTSTVRVCTGTDTYWKSAMTCGLPRSTISKSSFVRSVTGTSLPSVTTTSTVT